jgi:hypothetical protein
LHGPPRFFSQSIGLPSQASTTGFGSLLTISRAYIFIQILQKLAQALSTLSRSQQTLLPCRCLHQIVSQIIGFGFFAALGWLKKRKAAASMAAA